MDDTPELFKPRSIGAGYSAQSSGISTTPIVAASGYRCAVASVSTPHAPPIRRKPLLGGRRLYRFLRFERPFFGWRC